VIGVARPSPLDRGVGICGRWRVEKTWLVASGCQLFREDKDEVEDEDEDGQRARRRRRRQSQFQGGQVREEKDT
jgi:hypothetical protein